MTKLTIAEALDIVLDLARGETVINEDFEEWTATQMEAIDMVDGLRSRLDPSVSRRMTLDQFFYAVIDRWTDIKRDGFSWRDAVQDVLDELDGVVEYADE